MGLTKAEIVQIAVLLSACLVSVLNYTFLTPALPVIMADMNVTATTVQWLTSIYSMVEAVVIPLNAFLLGRFSTRKLFAGVFVVFAAGSLLAAVARTFAVLIVARILQACACGVVMPMVFTIVLLIAPRKNRGTIMGLVGLVISFAPAIGPVVSGAIIDFLGWRYLFAIVAVISLIVIALGLALLKNHEGFERTSFDPISIVFSSFGMVGLLYGLSTCTSTDTPWASAALMVVGIAFLALFVRRQRTLEVPTLRIETLKTRNFRYAIICIFFLEGALISLDVLIPLLVQNSLGRTPTVTGIVMAPAAITGAVAGIIGGRIFDKHGVRAIALVGAGLLVVTAAGLALSGFDTSVITVATLYMTNAIGWQFVSTPVNTWGINSLPNEVIQHGNAVSSTLMQVGASFGTAAIVSLTALGPLAAPAADAAGQMLAGYQLAFWGCTAFLAIVGIIVLTIMRDKPKAK